MDVTKPAEMRSNAEKGIILNLIKYIYYYIYIYILP